MLLVPSLWPSQGFMSAHSSDPGWFKGKPQPRVSRDNSPGGNPGEKKDQPPVTSGPHPGHCASNMQPSCCPKTSPSGSRLRACTVDHQIWAFCVFFVDVVSAASLDPPSRAKWIQPKARWLPQPRAPPALLALLATDALPTTRLEFPRPAPAPRSWRRSPAA